MGDEQAAPGDVVIVVTDTGITGPVDNLRIVSGSDDLLNANQSARFLEPGNSGIVEWFGIERISKQSA